MSDGPAPYDNLPTVYATAPDQDALSGLRILVAEPSHDIGNLVKIHLRRRGAAVEVVRDGLAVLNQVLNSAGKPGETLYDVILMEVDLPNMDGISATKRLRSAGYQRPIVAFSTNDSVSSVRECQRHGFDNYMAKPFLATDLTSCIRKTVDHELHGAMLEVAQRAVR